MLRMCCCVEQHILSNLFIPVVSIIANNVNFAVFLGVTPCRSVRTLQSILLPPSLGWMLVVAPGTEFRTLLPDISEYALFSQYIARPFDIRVCVLLQYAEVDTVPSACFSIITLEINAFESVDFF